MKEGSWMSLVPINGVTLIDSVQDDDSDEVESVPSPGDDMIRIGSSIPISDTVQWTQGFPMNPGADTANSDVPQAMMITLQHAQGIWHVSFSTDRLLDIGSAIRKALPHAQPEHFKTLMVDETHVSMTTILFGRTDIRIRFKTNRVKKMINTTFLPEALEIDVDLVWKVGDVAACVAYEAEVLPSAIQIEYNGHVLPFSDFVLMHPSDTFNAVGPACDNHGHDRTEQTSSEHSPPLLAICDGSVDHDLVNVDMYQEMIRLSLCHPRTGILRSAAFESCVSLHEAFQTLMP